MKVSNTETNKDNLINLINDAKTQRVTLFATHKNAGSNCEFPDNQNLPLVMVIF